MAEYIIPIISLLAGGGLGWIFTLTATRKKADAEAMASVQDVYQQAINDLNGYCDTLRKDRNELRADRDEMRLKNKELEEKVEGLQKDIQNLRIEIANCEAMIKGLTPRTCYVVDCPSRIHTPLAESK